MGSVFGLDCESLAVKWICICFCGVPRANCYVNFSAQVLLLGKDLVNWGTVSFFPLSGLPYCIPSPGWQIFPFLLLFAFYFPH